jgi:hypothetical protein
MAGRWTLSEKLAGAPQRIRPETHWFQETTRKGRKDGRLWFSLQLTLDRAEELCDAFAGSAKSEDFAGLIGKKFEGPKGVEKAVTMAPISYAALRFAIEHEKANLGQEGANDGSANSQRVENSERMLGTDILVHPAAFRELEALSEKHGIEITEAGLAIEGDVVESPLPKSLSAKSNTGRIPDDNRVIIAIIDDGIGIANHRFRAAVDKTRVEHFLDLALIGTPTANGSVDEPLGRSWRGSDIEKLLGQDEEPVYRALGLIDPASELRQPLRAEVTHGTHVLDLAAGYDWRTEEKEAEERPIIAVQLPTQVAENRSDTWLPQSLKRALDWILVKADELSAELSMQSKHVAIDGKPSRLPLIVNGSFGSLAGPQDGCSDVERRIRQFVKTYRGDGPEDLCTFVLSVGNALQLRAAAQMDILPGGVGEIPWRVLPDDKTPNFVQIWLPKVRGSEHPQQVQISLEPPRDGPGSGKLSQLGEAVEWEIGKDAAARIYHQRFPRPGGSRECITIATRPTADDQGQLIVPSGLWLIKIKNTTRRELRGIDLRVHRDDVGMFAHTGARQSYFDHPEYERFDPASGRTINEETRDDELYDDKRRDDELRKRGHWTRVTRQGTLSTYAFAEGVLAVGGYRRSDGQPAVYSSAGRRRKDPHGKLVDERTPDLAAVSEESPALPGVVAAGTYSGSVAILSGTSVAAPQVTRALADQISTRASAEEQKRMIPGTQPKAAGAAEKLKAAVGAGETAQGLVGHVHYEPHRPLRDGVGRLPFTFRSPSYTKRVGD